MSATRLAVEGRWPPLALGLGLCVGGTMLLSPWLPVVLLVGAVGALLVLKRPSMLIALMFAAMLFDQAGVSGMKVARLPITASKLSVLIVIGAWAVHVLMTGRRPLRWHPSLAGMMVFIASVGLSVAVSGDFWVGIFNLAGMSMLTVLVTVVMSVLAGEDLRLLTRTMAAILGVILVLTLGAAASGGRFTGTMGDPNEWATMLLLLVPTLIGALSTDRHALAGPMRFGLLCLAPLAILATQSRAAFLVFLLTVPGWLWLLRAHRTELGLALGGAVAAAITVFDAEAATARFRALVEVLTGRSDTVDSSLGERAELQRQAWDLFREYWLFGAGPGTFPVKSGFVPREGHLLPPHNTYLEVASEQGIIGLIALVIMGLSILWGLSRAFRQAQTPARRQALAGAIVGLGSFAMMAATLGLLTFSMAYLVLGLAFGLALHTDPQDDRGL